MLPTTEFIHLRKNNLWVKIQIYFFTYVYELLNKQKIKSYTYSLLSCLEPVRTLILLFCCASENWREGEEENNQRSEKTFSRERQSAISEVKEY